jgi:hypothetical protein
MDICAGPKGGVAKAPAVTWMAGTNRETGRGFLADADGGRFDFDLDADNVAGLIDALRDLVEQEASR